MESMPAAHRNALKALLESIKKHIVDSEIQLLSPLSDEERSKLIDKIAGLHVTQQNTEAALLGEDAEKPEQR
jgi:hypothetical protein